MALEIHPLKLADVQLDTSLMVWQLTPGTAIDAPCTAFLILGGSEPILVDSGIASDRAAVLPDARPDARRRASPGTGSSRRTSGCSSTPIFTSTMPGSTTSSRTPVSSSSETSSSSQRRPAFRPSSTPRTTSPSCTALCAAGSSCSTGTPRSLPASGPSSPAATRLPTRCWRSTSTPGSRSSPETSSTCSIPASSSRCLPATGSASPTCSRRSPASSVTRPTALPSHDPAVYERYAAGVR